MIAFLYQRSSIDIGRSGASRRPASASASARQGRLRARAGSVSGFGCGACGRHGRGRPRAQTRTASAVSTATTVTITKPRRTRRLEESRRDERGGAAAASRTPRLITPWFEQPVRLRELRGSWMQSSWLRAPWTCHVPCATVMRYPPPTPVTITKPRTARRSKIRAGEALRSRLARSGAAASQSRAIRPARRSRARTPPSS